MYLNLFWFLSVQCDEKLGIVSPRKLRRYTILLTLCTLSYSIIISCLDVHTWNFEVKLSKKPDNKGPLNYLPLYFMYLIIIMKEVQYAIITHNVGQRFCRLNKCLENILKSSKITDHFRKDLGLGVYFTVIISKYFCHFLNFQNWCNLNKFLKNHINL